MRSVDASSELADGVDLGPLPPMGPDGGIDAPDEVPIKDDPPPRICEQGPCVHYHVFTGIFDAQKPRGDRVSDGGIVEGDAPTVHEHYVTHHYCYPTVGIETALGDMAIVECNRWEPILAGAVTGLQRSRDAFLKSPAGQEYKTVLDAWRERQADIKERTIRMYEEASAEMAAAEAARLERAAKQSEPTSTGPEQGPVVVGDFKGEAP